MNLTQIGGLENRLRAGKTDRSDRARQECESAILSLQTAYEQGFSDKTLLKRAHAGFIAAIRFNRQDPVPYLGLTYLLILIGDPAMARKYLQEALRLEPESAEAMEVLQYLTALEKGTLTPASAGPAAPVLAADDTDFDAIYEQVESFVRKQLHSLMSRPVMPRPTLDPARLQSLRQEFAEVQQSREYIDRQMRILEAEIDTAMLANQLRPFESLSRRFEQALQLSETLGQVMGQLQAELNASRQLLLRAQALVSPAGLNALEQELELSMDRCDALADTLDPLENQVDDFKQLQAVYESLVDIVEEIRDALDLFSEQRPAQAVA